MLSAAGTDMLPATASVATRLLAAMSDRRGAGNSVTHDN